MEYIYTFYFYKHFQIYFIIDDEHRLPLEKAIN